MFTAFVFLSWQLESTINPTLTTKCCCLSQILNQKGILTSTMTGHDPSQVLISASIGLIWLKLSGWIQEVCSFQISYTNNRNVFFCSFNLKQPMFNFSCCTLKKQTQRKHPITINSKPSNIHFSDICNTLFTLVCLFNSEHISWQEVGQMEIGDSSFLCKYCMKSDSSLVECGISVQGLLYRRQSQHKGKRMSLLCSPSTAESQILICIHRLWTFLL